MANLTLQEVFGTNVAFDNAQKTITFSLSDLASSTFTITMIDDTNIDTYTSKILWSILQSILSSQPENTASDRGIYITNQGKRTVLRDGQPQFAFQLVVNGYTDDNLGVDLAPDDLV